MENDDTVTIEVNKTDLKHQLSKLILATVAGFAAQKAAESLFDKVTNRNSNAKTIDTDSE